MMMTDVDLAKIESLEIGNEALTKIEAFYLLSKLGITFFLSLSFSFFDDDDDENDE